MFNVKNISDLKVSDHSFVRFIQRNQKGIYDRYTEEILDAIKRGVQVKPKDSLRRMLKHGIDDTRYYRRKKRIFVIRDNTVITILLHNENPHLWEEVNVKEKVWYK